MRFLVFDCPSLDHQHLYYQERYEQLLSAITLGTPVLVLHSIKPYISPFCFTFVQEAVPNIRCHDKKHASNFTTHVLATQGEGTVVRMPWSSYLQGRSNNIIKFKVLPKPFYFTFISVLCYLFTFIFICYYFNFCTYF
jgi:ATP-dependent DNA ligase